MKNWNTSRMWVTLQCFRTTDQNSWTCVQEVSHSLVVWADQNYWEEWLNMCPVGESLFGEQIRTIDKNGWTWSRLWVALQCLCRSKSLTRMAKHASSKWVPLQCLSRSEPLTRIAEQMSRMWVTFQCLSDQNHWQEWLDTHPECKSLSSVWADQKCWWEWLNTFSK